MIDLKAHAGTSTKAETETVNISNDAIGAFRPVCWISHASFHGACAATVEVGSSHVAMVSNPELVIDVICALQKP
ncbi:MAG: hypothetical protein WAM74_14905 [Xanthobacteraceae bacterium]